MSRLIETLELGERRPLVTIENGDALALVKEELARQKTDLLVVGTHARSGMEHAPIGIAAEAILDRVHVTSLSSRLMGWVLLRRSATRWWGPSESARRA